MPVLDVLSSDVEDVVVDGSYALSIAPELWRSCSSSKALSSGTGSATGSA